MAYDISEIKKLPVNEKLQIIDELWETIESEETNAEKTFDEDPALIAMLQERIEKCERGEGVFYTVEEAMTLIKKRLEDFRQNKND